MMMMCEDMLHSKQLFIGNLYSEIKPVYYEFYYSVFFIMHLKLLMCGNVMNIHVVFTYLRTVNLLAAGELLFNFGFYFTETDFNEELC